MALGVTVGNATRTKTREETPIPGDLYTLTAPINVGGQQRGLLTLQFFVADTRTNQQVLDFIGGEFPPNTGPFVRWDV